MANAAKHAIRERSVYHVTIWDLTGIADGKTKIAHEFTTLANRAEVEQIVTDWLNPIKECHRYNDEQLACFFPYVVENKLRRTN